MTGIKLYKFYFLQSPDMDDSSSKSISINDSLVITVLTASVYLAFILKEIGYATIFNIPLEIVAMNSVTMAIAAKSILLAAIAYVGKVNIFWIFSPRGNSILSIKIRELVFCALLLGFGFYPYFIDTSYIWYFLIILILLIFLILYFLL